MDCLIRKSLESLTAAHSSVEQRYAERMRRTYHILQGYNPALAAEVFNQSRQKCSAEGVSATKIQAVYRGYRARLQYTQMLFEKYVQEERKQQDLDIKRMEEGLLLLENMQLEAELQERVFLNRQHEMEKTHAATMIQRAYRRFKDLPTPQGVLPQIVERRETSVLELAPETDHPKPQTYHHDILTPQLLDSLNCTGWLDTPLFSHLSPRRDLNITVECDAILHSMRGAESESSDDEPILFSKQHNVSHTSDFKEDEGQDESSLNDAEFPEILERREAPNDDFSMTLYKKKAARANTLVRLDRELLGRIDHQGLVEHAFSLWQKVERLSLELSEVLLAREDLKEQQGIQHRIIEHLLKEITM